ncbi:unnamed protein product [Camellia sinensis]
MGIQQPSMPIFAGENYDYWCVRMKTLFQSQDLWNLVQNGYDEPDSTTTLTSAQEQQLEETRKNDAKALLFIQQALSDELFPRIIEVKKSKEACGATSSLFNSTWQPTKRSFNSTFPSTGFYFGASSVSVAATNSAPMVFGSSTPSGSSDSIFSFASAASTATASSQAQPVFGSAVPVFTAAYQMSMEDSMAEDPVQASIMPAFPVFGQPPISAPSSGFMFGSTAPSPRLAFQFGSLQLNQRAPQNPSPFQSSGSLEFGAGGSFPLGSGAATDKRRLKIVIVKRKNRKSSQRFKCRNFGCLSSVPKNNCTGSLGVIFHRVSGLEICVIGPFCNMKWKIPEDVFIVVARLLKSENAGLLFRFGIQYKFGLEVFNPNNQQSPIKLKCFMFFVCLLSCCSLNQL